MSATTRRSALSPHQLGVGSLDTPLLIAVPAAARLLGIGTTLAWELVRAGDIPSVKLGRRVLIPRTALERLAHAPQTQERNHDGRLDTGHRVPLPTTQGHTGNLPF